MDFDLGNFSLSGSDTFDPYGGGNYSLGGGSPPLMDTSWLTQMTPQAGGDASPGGGGGGFWGDFANTASKLWGSSPTKSEQGTGFLGGLSDLGGIAKAVMPLASIGTGIASFMNQRDSMDQMERRGRVQDRALESQIATAEQARPMAAQTVDISNDIRNVAGNVGPLAERTAAIAPEVRSLTNNVRDQIMAPQQTFAADRLARAQRGEIPPAIQAQIEQWKAGELQKARQYFARAGTPDSTMMASVEADIERKAQAAAGEYLQNEEKMALAAFEGARGSAATAGGLYGTEGAALGTAANIFGSEANDLAQAGNVLGVGGNILAGAGRNAAGASVTAGAEQQQIAQLIAAIQAQLGRLNGGQ